MVHDSYLCKRSSFEGVQPKPFPTQREKGFFKYFKHNFESLSSFALGPYNFVGAAGPMEVKAVCPEECRPPDHQDWTLC